MKRGKENQRKEKRIKGGKGGKKIRWTERKRVR